MSAVRLRAHWNRLVLMHRHETHQRQRVRVMAVAAALAAVGYATFEAPGSGTADLVTCAVAVWVVGMALLWNPGRP